MNPSTWKDLGSTLAGGGAGVGLLLTVQWNAVPFGESVKIVVALTLIWMGYRGYRNPPQTGAAA